MKLSVLIPTYQRPEAIDRCLEHLAEQEYPFPYEVLVGLDDPTDRTPTPRVPASISQITTVQRFDHLGLIALRRALMEQATGEIILWLNDDAYAQPGLLEAHRQKHLNHGPIVVAGASKWKEIPQPTLFDRLVQDTGLLFFGAPTSGTNPVRTDFRNCYGLNMSFPRALAQRVGSLPELPESYGYEDIELVHRMVEAGAEVWYTPKALVIHDHQYQPVDVHRREYLLGRSAWHFAHANPAFALDVFKRDIRLPSELEYARQSLEREYRDALRIERSFLKMAQMTQDHPSDELLEVLSEHWVLLKRYLWRWGLVDAAGGLESRWSLLKDRSESVCDCSKVMQ